MDQYPGESADKEVARQAVKLAEDISQRMQRGRHTWFQGYFRLSIFGHRENVIEAVERIEKNFK